jgi:hypothetical protein
LFCSQSSNLPAASNSKGLIWPIALSVLILFS